MSAEEIIERARAHDRACDECGEPYPPDAEGMVGPWHGEGCSLNPRNTVGG